MIVVGGGEGAAVRTEREQVDGAAVTGQGITERARGGGIRHVPQPDRAVVRGAGQGAAVGAEHRGAHPAGVTGEGLAQRFGAGGVRDVPQPDGPVVAGRRQGPAVRAEGGQVDGSRVAEERCGQGRVHDRDQPVAHVLVVGPQAVCRQVELGGQRRVGVLDAVRLGDHLFEHRVVALLPGEHRRTDREQREDDQGRDRGPPDQDGAAAQPARGGQEVHRAAGQEGAGGGFRPAAGLLQPGAPVEQRGVAARLLPGPAVLLQPLPQQVAGAVLLDPVAQPRPGVQQCLVGDLHGVRVQGHQPGAHQRLQGLLGLGRVPGLLRQPAPGAPPAGGLGVLAHPDQPQQQQPGGVAGRRVQVRPGPLGGGGHRALDAAGRAVAGQRQPARLAALPGGEQGVGQQRQDARVVGAVRAVGTDLPDDQFRQSRFQLHAHGPGRAGHRLAQFRGGQRPEHHVPVLQGVGQFGVAQTLFVEVGAHAEGDLDGRRVLGAGAGCAGGLEDADERASGPLVRAEGEDLLELVHDQDRPGRLGGLGGLGDLGGLGGFRGRR